MTVTRARVSNFGRYSNSPIPNRDSLAWFRLFTFPWDFFGAEQLQWTRFSEPSRELCRKRPFPVSWCTAHQASLKSYKYIVYKKSNHVWQQGWTLFTLSYVLMEAFLMTGCSPGPIQLNERPPAAEQRLAIPYPRPKASRPPPRGWQHCVATRGFQTPQSEDNEPLTRPNECQWAVHSESVSIGGEFCVPLAKSRCHYFIHGTYETVNMFLQCYKTPKCVPYTRFFALTADGCLTLLNPEIDFAATCESFCAFNGLYFQRRNNNSYFELLKIKKLKRSRLATCEMVWDYCAEQLMY